ncbi:MAG: endonuclease domain-containing protein [Hyphomonadaceae bacterium]
MRKDEAKSRRFAKTMRRELTRAELLLWTLLRRRQMQGAHFRRQHPIGPYIADFACVAAKLVVEVDGATHWTEAELAHDARRTKFLRAQDWQVLRVTNADVYENLDGVWETIAARLPPPRPSAGPPPQAGEE